MSADPPPRFPLHFSLKGGALTPRFRHISASTLPASSRLTPPRCTHTLVSPAATAGSSRALKSSLMRVRRRHQSRMICCVMISCKGETQLGELTRGGAWRL